MRKPIKIDGQYYRWRRGRLVLIPPEWKGQVVSRQKINARQSKQVRKLRRFNPDPHRMMPGLGSRTHEKREKIQEGLDGLE